MTNLEIEKIKYAKYKMGFFDDLDANTLLDMQVLELLEESGYSLDVVGTYLFRDMIVEISKHLTGEDTHRKMFEYKELIKELSDPFSQFYMDLARNNLDIGIKTFHDYLEEAQTTVDLENYDTPEAMKSVVQSLPYDMDYGKAAFLAGAYISKKICPSENSVNKEYKRARIKKIRNSNEEDYE